MGVMVVLQPGMRINELVDVCLVVDFYVFLALLYVDSIEAMYGTQVLNIDGHF